MQVYTACEAASDEAFCWTEIACQTWAECMSYLLEGLRGRRA